MAVNWSEPKVETEKVKIEPEVLLVEAKKYANSGNYNMAERAYVNAASNARGTQNLTAIVKTVKKGLADIYIQWAIDCIKRYEYQDAEPVLQKLVKIADDKTSAKNELIALYSLWGAALRDNDNNWKGAIAIYAKKWRIEKEIGVSTDETAKLVCLLLYGSNNKKYKKIANRINLGIGNNRLRLFFSALVLTLVAIIIPIFSPYSVEIFVLSCLFGVIEEPYNSLNAAARHRLARNCLLLTAGSLIMFVVIYDNAGSSFPITFLIIVFISLKLLMAAIVKYGRFFDCRPLNLDATIKSIVSETDNVDLSVKRKPTVASSENDHVADASKYALGRIGFHAGRFIIGEILRNIRF